MSIFNIPASLLEAVKQVVLNEHELTRREVLSVNGAFKDEIAAHKEATKKITGHVFPEGVDRLVVPMASETTDVQKKVEDHIHKNGFHSSDYKAGVTKDIHNRAVSIGRALTKTNAPKELIDSYAPHQQVVNKNPESENLQVVISKHPHDVIGMSHGTDWGLRPTETHVGKDRPTQSCMAFNTPQFNNHMAAELKAGTHVAWLTKKGDDEAKEPLARMSLRPFAAEEKGGDSDPHYRTAMMWLHHDHPLMQGARDFYDDVKHDEKDYPKNMLMDRYMTMAMDPEFNEDVKIHPFSHIEASPENDHNNHHAYIIHYSDRDPLPMRSVSELRNAIKEGWPSNHSVSVAPIHRAPVVNEAIESNPILVPGKKIYGQHSDAFKNTVNQWAKTNTPPEPGKTYIMKHGVYSDNDPTSFVG